MPSAATLSLLVSLRIDDVYFAHGSDILRYAIHPGYVVRAAPD